MTIVGLFKVTTTFTGPQGSPWYNTLWFDATGGTEQQAVTAAGAFWTAWKPFLSNTASFSCGGPVETYLVSTGQPAAVVSTTPVTGTGTQSLDMIPIASQSLLRLRTGVYTNGRELRGRVFLPGATVSSNVGGAPSSGLQSTMTSAGQTLLADGTCAWAVYSRVHKVAEQVASTSVWAEYAQLRSRRD